MILNERVSLKKDSIDLEGKEVKVDWRTAIKILRAREALEKGKIYTLIVEDVLFSFPTEGLVTIETRDDKFYSLDPEETYTLFKWCEMLIERSIQEGV